MTNHDVVVAVFSDHRLVEAALHRLIDDGFEMNKFSLVGKSHQNDEAIADIFNAADRMKLRGKYGAFWGEVWGLFLGDIFITIPVLGPVVVLGYLAMIMVSTIRSAVAVDGVTAIGASIVGLGIPKDSAIKYETAIKSDGFLVMGRGTSEEIPRARALLGTLNPCVLETHENLMQTSLAGQAICAGV